jgi:transposase, IS30 family
MATLVERQSRFTLLVKVAGKDTASVVSALIPQVQHSPSFLDVGSRDGDGRTQAVDGRNTGESLFL